MELLRQDLRMTLYGSGDHSGGVWAMYESAPDGLAGATWTSAAGHWQDAGFAATAGKGDTPRRGAHVT
jgi:hypothetical protein